MNGIWKAAILALGVYAIWVTTKLTSLIDATFQRATDAAYHDPQTLDQTVWGKEDLSLMHAGMMLVGLVFVVAIVGELVSAVRAQQRAAATGDAPPPA